MASLVGTLWASLLSVDDFSRNALHDWNRISTIYHCTSSAGGCQKSLTFQTDLKRTLISTTSSSEGSRKRHIAIISMARETPPRRRNMRGTRSNTSGLVKYLNKINIWLEISFPFDCKSHGCYPLVLRVVSWDVLRWDVIRVYKLGF